MKPRPVPRKPGFDWTIPLAGARLQSPTLSYGFVASSLIIAPFEAFIAGVTQRALDRDGAMPQSLRDAARALIDQELEHGKQHRRLNVALAGLGFGGFESELSRVRHDFATYFKHRNPAFGTAYCAAFELFGLILADFYFFRLGQAGEEGAGHPLVESMWKWHFAEEYEHRCVALDVYEASFASAARAYFYRTRISVVVLRDLFRWSSALVKAMKGHDAVILPAEDCERLNRQQKLFDARWGPFFMARAPVVLMPGYRPERVRWGAVDSYLSTFEAQGGEAAPPVRAAGAGR